MMPNRAVNHSSCSRGTPVARRSSGNGSMNPLSGDLILENLPLLAKETIPERCAGHNGNSPAEPLAQWSLVSRTEDRRSASGRKVPPEQRTALKKPCLFE